MTFKPILGWEFRVILEIPRAVDSKLNGVGFSTYIPGLRKSSSRMRGNYTCLNHLSSAKLTPYTVQN
jgi:hypothetical protein